MKLGVFFTRGVSLEYWFKSGLFYREKLLYERYLKSNFFSGVIWFTYGTGDYNLARNLKESGHLAAGIEIVQMPIALNRVPFHFHLYTFLLPFIRFRFIRECTVLKTNQMDGCIPAIVSKFLFNKPLVLRTGYVLSQLEEGEHPNKKMKNFVIRCIEKIALRNCDHAIVTSNHNLEYFNKKYAGLRKAPISVIGNYIDLDLFLETDLVSSFREKKVVFVGRLEEVKNLSNVIIAVSALGLQIDIYGEGSLRKRLEAEAREIGANVRFKGMVPNTDLPRILQAYKYYVLASFQEGLPKTLIEAMASGCVCIGTNVNGINELIKDAVTGYLSPTTNSTDIQATIKRAMLSDNSELICRAKAYVKEKYSLTSILIKEQALISRVLGCQTSKVS